LERLCLDNRTCRTIAGHDLECPATPYPDRHGHPPIRVSMCPVSARWLQLSENDTNLCLLEEWPGDASSPSASSAASARSAGQRGSPRDSILPISPRREVFMGSRRIQAMLPSKRKRRPSSGHLRQLRAAYGCPLDKLGAAAPRLENGAFAEPVGHFLNIIQNGDIGKP
jgi:hypothetical protein